MESWSIIKRAFADTIGFFGWNWRTLITPILFLIGFPVMVTLFGWESAMEEFNAAISFLIIPLGFFALVLIIWNLIAAPSRILYESFGKDYQNDFQQRIVSLENKVKSGTQAYDALSTQCSLINLDKLKEQFLELKRLLSVEKNGFLEKNDPKIAIIDPTKLHREAKIMGNRFSPCETILRTLWNEIPNYSDDTCTKKFQDQWKLKEQNLRNDAKHRDPNDVNDKYWWANDGNLKLRWHILESNCDLVGIYLRESEVTLRNRTNFKWNK